MAACSVHLSAIYISFSVGSKQRPFGRTKSSAIEVSFPVFALIISTLLITRTAACRECHYNGHKLARSACIPDSLANFLILWLAVSKSRHGAVVLAAFGRATQKRQPAAFQRWEWPASAKVVWYCQRDSPGL